VPDCCAVLCRAVMNVNFSHGRSRAAVHQGLHDAGMPLNAEDFQALLITTRAERGGQVRVGHHSSDRHEQGWYHPLVMCSSSPMSHVLALGPSPIVPEPR
jgi:hypothetical protein